MSTGQTTSTTNVTAVKALVMAALGVVLGIFAFKLQLRGGDDRFLTYGLGVACSGFYIASLTNLVKALAARNTPQPGGPGLGQVLAAACTGTLVGICVFPLCSIIAVHLSEFDDLNGFETFVGLILSATAFAGPLLLGGIYFYFLQQSLCDAGLNIAAAVLTALLAALASIFLWYYLNIRFGPQLYHLLL